MSDSQFSASRIAELFTLLNAELARTDVVGEVFVVGGAVMCLVHNARPSTRDVDALFLPAGELRQAAARVAESEGIPRDWLNDGVKAFLSESAEFDAWAEFSNLKVYTAHTEYLLALKAAAMRIGKEYEDLNDVRFLLRALNITTLEAATSIITKYIDEASIHPKTWYALQELLEA